MILNFNFQILTLDGIEGGVASKSLAHHIALATQCQEPLKFYGWAKKLHDNGILDLDNSDVDKLKLFIETCPGMNVLGKGTFLGAIREAELHSLKEKNE